jgi:hypothetical protein
MIILFICIIELLYLFFIGRSRQLIFMLFVFILLFIIVAIIFLLKFCFIFYSITILVLKNHTDQLLFLLIQVK